MSWIPNPGDILFRAWIAPGTTSIFYDRYRVEKLTEEGFWMVGIDTARRTWRGFNTRFASTTKDEAVERLKARTRAYVRHARRRLKDAEKRCGVLGIQVPAERILY